MGEQTKCLKLQMLLIDRLLSYSNLYACRMLPEVWGIDTMRKGNVHP